jgi:hypothetical protein
MSSEMVSIVIFTTNLLSDFAHCDEYRLPDGGLRGLQQSMEACEEKISLLEIAVPKYPRKFNEGTPEVTPSVSNSRNIQ